MGNGLMNDTIRFNYQKLKDYSVSGARPTIQAQYPDLTFHLFKSVHSECPDFKDYKQVTVRMSFRSLY